MFTTPGRLVIAVAAILSVATACGGSNNAPQTTCPNDTPPACPSPAPTYSANVAPILQDRCGLCHSPGGVEEVRLLQTYDQVNSQITSVLTQIHACQMPPRDQPQLTEDERQVVLGWIVCGAMNN